jgi:hypothetical protein
MNLLKPAVVALVAAGLVSSAFAAYGHKSRRATHAGYHKVSKASGATISGSVEAGIVNGNSKIGAPLVEGKYQAVDLANANLSLDANASSKVHAHFSLYSGSNAPKTLTHANGLLEAAGTQDTGVALINAEAGRSLGLTEAVVSYGYKEASMVFGFGYLPVSVYQANHGVLNSWSQSFNQSQENYIGYAYKNKHGADAGVYLYTQNRTSTAKKAGIAFAAAANYTGKQRNVSYKLHAGLLSSGAQALDTTTDNMKLNTTIMDVSATKAASSYNVLGQVDYKGFGLTAEYTGLGKFNDTASINNKPTIMHFCLHYSGKANRMPFNAFVGMETFDKKGNAVVMVKDSTYVGASMEYVKGWNLYAKFVSDKMIVAQGSKQNTYFTLGGAVNF